MKKKRKLLLSFIILFILMFSVNVGGTQRNVLNINWNLISAVGKQIRDSESCSCFSLAYCRTALDGYVHKWYEYNDRGTNQNKVWCNWGKGAYISEYPTNKQVVFKAMYEQINAGRPVIVHVKGSRALHHYVAVVGYENVSSVDMLSESNFLIIDTITGTPSDRVENMAAAGYSLKLCNAINYQYVYTNSGSISSDNKKPEISNVKITKIDATGYTVTCTVKDNIGVSRVVFPTWTWKNDQDDLVWHTGKILNDTASVTIPVSSHNNESGGYATHIYAYDAAGNWNVYYTDGADVPAPDNIKPTIKNVRITDVSNSGYTIKCDVWDNKNLSKIVFESWTPDKGGYDDKKVESKTSGFAGENKTSSISFKIYTKDHNNEKGRYATHIYAYDKAGNMTNVLVNVAIGGKYWTPTATTTYNGHTYELYDTTYWNWTTAKAYCDSVGGYLVCITSAKEQEIISGLLEKGKRTDYWMGATDQYKEGDWTWVTGEKMSYNSKWANRDNWNNVEHYSAISKKTKLWNDVPEEVRDAKNDGIFGFICEYNKTSTGSTVTQKKTQTITASNVTKSYGSKAFALGAKLTSGNGKLTYSSSNKKVATISSSGKVTIKGVGKTTITIKAAATSTYKAASKKITVTVKKGTQKISASSVIKNVGDKSFSLGVKRTVGNGKLTYKSSDTKVATITSSGKVTIKGAGITTITIKAAKTSTYNAASKKVTITVRPKTVSISSLKNSSSKKMTVQWKRNSAVTGYKIQYATNSKFTNAKTVTIKNNKTLSTKITVTKGKTYYVRIKTYKGSVSSGWSSEKKVKIRK